MKPTWDRLMKEFENSETALIADVDCTAAGKELCKRVGVNGYPTLKYGHPSNLEKYDGGRGYDELLKFAKENLGPICGPDNMDLCDDEQKAKIELLIAKGLLQLTIEIDELEEIMKSAEETFNTGVQKLQTRHKELKEEKEETIAAAKDKDLVLMKAVRSSLETKAAEHDEL